MARRAGSGEGVTEEALVDEILSGFKGPLGTDHAGYRNHVCRVVRFCIAQRELTEEERRKSVIAAAFHDLGIWTAKTFDYIPPSLELAREYLANNGLESWEPAITQMIGEHHKITRFADDGLTEMFRRADLVDFSLGAFKCGLPRHVISDVRSQFPNAGFHKFLIGLAGRWVCRHPFNPVPVLKW